jgi:hypothetical protein
MLVNFPPKIMSESDISFSSSEMDEGDEGSWPSGGEEYKLEGVIVVRRRFLTCVGGGWRFLMI